MEEETNIADKQQTIREKRIANLQPYQFRKGQSGNPLGRYMGGKSGKERVKAIISKMTDEEFEDWLEGLNKLDIWQMGEGRPDTAADITSKGERIMYLPSEIMEKNDITPDTKPSSEGQT